MGVRGFRGFARIARVAMIWLILFCGSQRIPDAHVNGIDDGDAGGEFFQIGAPDKIRDEFIDGNGAERDRSEENDSGMGAGRILAQVGEFYIQCQQHALFILS
jgi:hypothetical protein